MLFFTLCWLWALGAFFQLAFMSLLDMLSFICLLVIFGALFYFLALQDDLGSWYIFPTLVIESVIFLRRSDFFYWRMLLEIKIYVLGVLFATEVLLLLSYFSWHKQGNIYMCVSTKRLPWSLGWQESACNAGDLGSIPGSGRSRGEENGYPLLYFCQDPMDRGAWGTTVHRVIRSQTWLSD